MKQSKLLTIAIVLILLSVILVGCPGPIPSPAPTPVPTPELTPTPTPTPTGDKRVETRDLVPDPKAIGTGEMLFGVTGAPLEATAEAPFIEEDVGFRDHPLQLDVGLPELTVQEVDLGDVLKVPFTARSIAPSQPGSTFIELYVVVDDRLVGTARYPSTGYLEEVAFEPDQVQPGDTFGVDSTVYIGSIFWPCPDPDRIREVEIIAVLWTDSGRSHANGPWDGGSPDGLWSIYREIRDGASEPIEGVSRLNFKEESRPFIVSMPFFATIVKSDNNAPVATHPGNFSHRVQVVQRYWDYPVEPTELGLFPSDKAVLTLHGFAPGGNWVGMVRGTVLLPPLRDDADFVEGTIGHTGADHFEVEVYNTDWWVSASGQNTLFPDEAGFAAQFLFDWVADRVWIAPGGLCKDTFKVADVSEESKPPCFACDTLVLMADNSLKRISDVQVGEMVLAYDVDTGQTVVAEVTATNSGEADHYYLINGNLKVTPPHPFFTAEGKWAKVADLKVGDKVRSLQGPVEITSIERVNSGQRICNISVGDFHNFFVSANGKDSYLVQEGS